MTVNEALAQLTGPIHAEFAAAVENRWQASEREHRANQAHTASMRDASRVLRGYIRRQLKPHMGDGQSIEFTYDNADSCIRWDTKPGVSQPHVAFTIYLGDHMQFTWSFIPTSENDLAQRMRTVIHVLEASRKP